MGFGSSIKSSVSNAVGFGAKTPTAPTSGSLIRQEDLLNRFNINTSGFGSRSFTTDPNTGRSILNINESPAQKQIRELQEQQAIGLLGDASSVNRDLSRNVDTVRQSVFDKGLSLLQPQIDADRRNLETSLVLRGIQPGTEAYSTAIRDFDRNFNEQKNNLSLDAVAAGSSEQDRLVRLAELQRGFRFGEAAPATTGIDTSLFNNVQSINAADIGLKTHEASVNRQLLENARRRQRANDIAGLLTGGVRGFANRDKEKGGSATGGAPGIGEGSSPTSSSTSNKGLMQLLLAGFGGG